MHKNFEILNTRKFVKWNAQYCDSNCLPSDWIVIEKLLQSDYQVIAKCLKNKLHNNYKGIAQLLQSESKVTAK